MYPKNFKTIHIELTDKCQASCPMCARNSNGGSERSFVGKNEITLDQFKNWFSPKFLKTINKLYACGNYGDPIIAQECLEIFEYIRDSNPECRLGLNTNGSARSQEWWHSLAKVLGKNHKVSFGIDGFSYSHSLYRRGTDYNKIISNARAFINAGGNAVVDCLVFKHNQHEIKDFEKEMLKIGFSAVNFKYTRRFYNLDKFPVENKSGDIEYYLEPAITETPINFIPLENISVVKDFINQSVITPSCIEQEEIYIDSRGNVFPCCWVGSDWIELPIEEKSILQEIRNLTVDNTKVNFSTLGINNLNNSRIDDIIWNDIDTFIKENKPYTCIKNCNARK